MKNGHLAYIALTTNKSLKHGKLRMKRAFYLYLVEQEIKA